MCQLRTSLSCSHFPLRFLMRVLKLLLARQTELVELHFHYDRLTLKMAGNLTRSNCFSLMFSLVVLGIFAASVSSAFSDEELRSFFDYEEESAYPNQWEETRSAESGEGDDLRYHELEYQVKQYPSYPKIGWNRLYQQFIAVQPQPYYGTCRNTPQCKSCKAPTVPSYQPTARSVRVELRTWQHQLNEDSVNGEYELRYYATRPRKASLIQCNKECKADIIKIPVKKPYFNPAAQYSPNSYDRNGR